MANKRKSDKRKTFNRAGGMHTKLIKKRQKADILRKEEKIKCYASDKRKYPSYSLVTKPSIIGGKICTKIIVRRTPIIKDKQSKAFRLGHSSLKFVIKTISNNLNGYRIVNLDMLKDHVSEITLHAAVCKKAQEIAALGQSPISLRTETKKSGLSSILWASCHGCTKQFPLTTSPEHSGAKTSDINIRAVWGTMSTGGGCSSLTELLGTMSCPTMHPATFSRIEEQISTWWEGILNEEMMAAGAQEKRLAVERGEFCDGIPAITVVCDGGWSKRSHKHTYNASGGVGVIFGAETKKLLYIGIRNKFCYICSKSESNSGPSPSHKCFKNWNESSQAMESDIIVQGFLQAESVHGVRYMRVIADGDSSTYSKIIETVPVWGSRVEKMECANHACKCLRSNLEKLVVEKPNYKGKGKLTKQARVRLTTAVRCAIRMRSKENNVKLLAHDIRNSVHHIFGFHTNCTNFCKQKSKTTTVNDDDNDDETDNVPTDDIEEMCDIQADCWNMGTEQDMESSRNKFSTSGADVTDIIRDVSVLLNRMALKSKRLLGNFTTNLAESWMHIRSKFDGAKVINRCNRGSWHARCFGGALRTNLGPAWSPIAFQKVTGTSPGHIFCETFRQKSAHLARSLKCQRKDTTRQHRRKRKLQRTAEGNSKKAKKDYGAVLDDTPDVPAESLKQISSNFFNKVVKKTNIEINEIEKKTKDQSLSELWKNERKIRLTSSNFGKVMTRRISNISTNLVKNLLYSNFKGNIRTIRGLAEEDNTRIEYMTNDANIASVCKAGLVICSDEPFLAASTDGKVIEKSGGQGLLEIKNLLQSNKYYMREAVKSVPNFCLKLSADNKLTLKTTHHYYYQCQGQMNILNMEWLDFVVRRCNPYELFVERLYRDKELWRTTMLPKLKTFYKKFLLPEISLPRYGTTTGIRAPSEPWYTETDIHILAIPDIPKSPTPSTSVASDDIQVNIVKAASVREKQPHSPIASTSTGTCISEDALQSLCRTPDVVVSFCASVRLQQTEKKTFVDNSLYICNRRDPPSTDPTPVGVRGRRKTTKFVGRRIMHEWVVDEKTGETTWYNGTVLDVYRGSRDGQPNAEYQVLYDGDSEHYMVDHLQEDLTKGSLKFIDL